MKDISQVDVVEPHPPEIYPSFGTVPYTSQQCSMMFFSCVCYGCTLVVTMLTVTSKQNYKGLVFCVNKKLDMCPLQQLKGVSTDYKLTLIQWLFNVGPSSPVLGSIHSAVVSTSCWRYQHDAPKPD